MAKSPKFDRVQVIEKAMNLYWEKGYHATSMRALQDAIDMRPGSIYASFGSKDGLFKEALTRYLQLGVAQLRNHCEQSGSPMLGLKAFVKELVVDSQHTAPSGMCMLAKSVAELTEESPELLATAKTLLNQMEAQMAEVLAQAQSQGECDTELSAAALAQHLQIQILGLRNYARANSADLPLAQMVDDLFARSPFAK